MSHTNWNHVQECIDDLRCCRKDYSRIGAFDASEVSEAVRAASAAMDAATRRGYATDEEEQAAEMVCRAAERTLA